MRAKAYAAIAAAVATAVLFSAVGAATAAKPSNRHPKPTYKTIKPSTIASFYVAGTHHFLIVATLRDRHALSVSVIPTTGKGFSTTTYSLEARQPAGSDGIKANLGKLGSIDVRFLPESSHREEPLPGCEGEGPRMEKGRFVGQIRFRGEGGYTRADFHAAAGQILVQPKLRCNVGVAKAELNKLVEEVEEEVKQEEGKKKGPPEAEESQPEIHLVKLKAKAKGRHISFEAARISAREPGKKGTSFTSFSVKAERHRGRIDEVSSASLLFEPGSAFKVPDLAHLAQEGVIKPPSPFSGSATYRRESSQALSWTGDLAVTLPGFGDVSLAGRRTTATVCADDGCRTKQ